MEVMLFISITFRRASVGAPSPTFVSFGTTTASSGSLVNPFRFTSREMDSETMLYYMRARHFDPATGRFISEDPIGFRPESISTRIHSTTLCCTWISTDLSLVI